ncbi:2-hydroxyacid dehydrogenase [Candidatus Poribacteria bacterium]
MISKKPVALFAFSHPWTQEMMLKAAPPDFEVRFLENRDEQTLQRELPFADLFVTTFLPAKWVPLLKRCKLVQHQGVGYDDIDVEALTEAGIPFAITPDGTVIGVAEHTILFILALSKQLVQVHNGMNRGEEFDPMLWRPNSHFFYGRTLGIVGFGRIGRRVGRLVRSFEVELIYYDVIRAPESLERELNAKYMPFQKLLTISDVISVHTPLTSETEGLFGKGEFARMKPGAFFINTGRGGTYDMDALYENLKSGHLGGAGLDVYNPEPPPMDHPIFQLPNVICTPHMATGTVEAHIAKAEAQFNNLRRVLRGEEPHNLVKI